MNMEYIYMYAWKPDDIWTCELCELFSKFDMSFIPLPQGGNDPFKKSGQLLSIHSFVHKDGRRKQFPLVFAWMSRKTEEDYVAVFRAILESLQETQVEEFTVDFELG